MEEPKLQAVSVQRPETENLRLRARRFSNSHSIEYYRLHFFVWSEKGIVAMKSFHLVSWMALFGLAVTQASAEEIESKNKFLELVADKKLTQGETWVKILKDGVVEGKGPEAGKISGTWEWKGKYYCRDIVIDDVPLPHDCQAVSITGDSVTFAHKDGSGISVSWTIE